ncbi:hypothetical protein HYH03_016528 [Edaphochlamys debaryana]|uniref:MMS19 nucleotide excision repair protein n=1 Tax=Edaphochlamys debaryana TaxID=47281 RepID=A0A835XPK9_9CHLO|nr:hypothetical protein HYH03_016528 [Edaphochlamys debaryana]|eukprot:KAG2484700.1 hypothetical protein HYH03_016528 [Edaphochlamys debaryana]
MAAQLSVQRACSELGDDESRSSARDEIVLAVGERKMTVLEVALALQGPLTSPEREARENGTRVLGEIASRCRGVLNSGELHTLSEFLAARLRDWPCAGAAATACRALLQPPSPYDAGPAPAATLGEASAGAILEATAEALRTAQSLRQEERSALLQLLLAALGGGWAARLAAAAPAGGAGGAAAPSGLAPALLDAFLGAVDGEKDPRCLLLAFESVAELCRLFHSRGVDPAPLRQASEELVDWLATYFPISFNPPPAAPGARNRSITRAELAAGLHAAMASSPFLAGGVLQLLAEKLSSTYRPAKEDSLSALRRCCAAYGPDALAPHLGQVWSALRSELLQPVSHNCGGGAAGDADGHVAGAAAAAACLTAVARAAGPGALDRTALQDASMSDLVAVVRAARGGEPGAGAAGGGGGGGPSSTVAARADRQVLCGALLVSAVCAAGPGSTAAAQTAVLGPVQAVLAEALAGPAGGGGSGSGTAVYDRPDAVMYGMTLLASAAEAVAAELVGGPPACVSSPADGAAGVAAMTDMKRALTAALSALSGPLLATDADADVSMDTDSAPPPSSPLAGFSPAAAAQLRLAVVAAWRALLSLHMGYVGVLAGMVSSGGVPPEALAALAALTLSPEEVAAAAEQLCTCALAAAAAAAAGGSGSVAVPSRMAWGRQVDACQEAAAALQQLLSLPSLPAEAAASGGRNAATSAEAVVTLLVRQLTEAMSPASSTAAEGAATAAEALRLAVSLAEAASQSPGAAAFSAAWLAALPPLLVGTPSRRPRESWLRPCLAQLASRVLPAAARTPSSAAAAAAAAASLAAHGLAAAALTAAAEWDASAAAASDDAEQAMPFVGIDASGGFDEPPLMDAWCAAVEAAVSCCDDNQQLGLAMEAAEVVSAAAAAAAAANGAAMPRAALPLAAAVIAGLRPAVLAPHSTQAVADGLLRLLSAATSPAAASGTATHPALRPAAVALAAAVNRWQDAAALDAWLTSAFRPTLLAALAVPPGRTAAAAPAAAVVAAVGWVGRALALRTHPALSEITTALLACLTSPSGVATSDDMEVDAPAAAAVPGAGGAAGSAEAAAAFGLLVAEAAEAGGVELAARPAAAVCRVLWQQRCFSMCLQALAQAASAYTPPAYSSAGDAGGPALTPDPLPLPLAAAAGNLAAAAPAALCRQDAPRLVPLLVRSARRLAAALSKAPSAPGEPSGAGPSSGPSLPPVALAAALRGALRVVREWLNTQAGPQPNEALGKALVDCAPELVGLVCAATAVTAGSASSSGGACGGAGAAPLGAATCAVREEALRCVLALMDAVPYHVLHPMRQQVLRCVTRTLDDNKRGIRQLAVKARRVWADK